MTLGVREYADMLIRVSNYSVDFCHLSARAALRQVSLALRKGVLSRWWLASARGWPCWPRPFIGH